MKEKDNKNVDADYEYSRKTYYELIEKSKETLDLMADVARESEHPRAFEVFGNMVKQIADVNDKLMDVNAKLKKVKSEAPENIILVLDATTGQNIVSQVEIFQQMVNITGIIMTKLDGSAKGGILISVADRFQLPIHAIGVGETLDDLQPFDPEEFATALIGDFRE